MPSGYVQYKGTDICIDLECECGWDDHFDGFSCYGFVCPECGNSYLLPEILEFTKADVSPENKWKFICPHKNPEGEV